MKLVYKRINISLKKIKIYLKIIKKKKISKIINFLNILNNKISLIIKKILISSLFYIDRGLILDNIYATKSIKIIKKNFRAKGKMDFFKKRFCNIVVILKNGK
ncbi:50S ribosomal subunit protein L22 [Candidatus Vidania fulgoroideae]|uniref:50S ribosomal protein L22 n=1 Tax=Candidatus Vidania fulgoroideorum TaxID=881286 RepID=A0A346E0N6_9PROT|nr:50S ribosomal subunit protein L22 [Candidatus Vidania fulgoroideae]